MDKVLFFKMGKFYELFEMDAHVGAKELDLQYMKGEQPRCGFPEKNFSLNVEKLARKGYRVLVVEQIETPEQLELCRKEKGSKDKFGDDAECSSLRCLLSELRPVEIVKPAKMLSSETERVMVRHTRNPSVNELATLSEFWDAEKTVQEVKTIYKHIGDLSASGPLNKTNLDTTNLNVGEYRPSCLPSILSEFVNKGENGSLALPALGGALYYLKQAFLDETLLIFVKFDSLPCSDFYEDAKKPYMILDAAALENLEIFENSRNVDTSGTLYAQLNHCVTAFGKRLLKTWLARPLYHLESVKDRRDAVVGLRGVNQPMMVEFQKVLSRLPDFEGLLARIFSTRQG
ncbi:hypothetical protein NC652_007463 [Populus alba x Populus x berolinensis]|nr:hypothetical protein NC652_007463 [Populus alba x Populus x berolinensis]